MNPVQKIFNKLGYTVIKSALLKEINLKSRGGNPSTMIQGLFRARDRQFLPKTVIDVGAAKGVWTVKCKEVFPDADYVLFEPLAERNDELETLAQDPKIHHVNAAAGAEPGEVHFVVTEDLDGSAVAAEKGNNTRTVPVKTVAEEVNRLNLEGPYLLKLDTHGFEVPIIEGAEPILDKTELVIIESYGFYVAQDALLLHQMCAFMEKKGFRLIDMVDTLYRPGDQAFWQCDVFFARADNDLFSSNRYL